MDLPQGIEEIPTGSTTNHLPPIVDAMISHIANASSPVFFRSQQINDPEISLEERTKIATSFWHSGPCKFLSRFRGHLSAEHLQYFDERNDYAANEEYEIRFYLSEARDRLTNRKRDVRNRRFAAMQRMLKDDDCSYFSETEMMGREPLLYERLVGQFMTDGERRLRDKCDVDGDDVVGEDGGGMSASFSRVLLDGIAKQHLIDLRRRQEDNEAEDERKVGTDHSNDEEFDDDENEIDGVLRTKSTEVHANGIIDDEYYPQVPPSFQKHWGDFDEAPKVDVHQPAETKTTIPLAEPSTSRAPQQRPPNDPDRRQRYVTADEKQALCDEFYTAMYESFLDGHDRDFDYATVDDNADLDDLEQLNRDQEEKYFDSDDDGITNGELGTNSLDADSDDDLDKYMREINAST